MLAERQREGVAPNHRGAEVPVAGNEANVPMPEPEKMVDGLVDALSVIHSQVGDESSSGSQVQKHHRHVAGGKFFQTVEDCGTVPAGGNFLYEDGSVSWRKFSIANYRNTIDVGSKSSGWVVFYRPANLTAGPW